MTFLSPLLATVSHTLVLSALPAAFSSRDPALVARELLGMHPVVRESDGRERDLTNGPGKLCAAFGITSAFDGTSRQRGPVRIVRGAPVHDTAVHV